jgi:predicted RNA-binding Zn ribbon-like protein
MARRKCLSVAEFPLIGGSLCLDFMNTTGARASGIPRERLSSYGDLLVWSRRAGILTDRDTERLGQQAEDRAADANAALERLREVREGLYRLFRPIADGREPPSAALTQLGKWWHEDRRRRELVLRDGTTRLELQVREEELNGMLWPVVASAVDLLTSDVIQRVKRCGECDWVFVDESKNGSRKWCKKDCGDRARARRHYARTRDATSSR